MSKVQTFEEWFAASKWESEVRAVARNVWKAAHENAAMVCEGQSLTTQPDECADAIREAANS